MFLGWQDRVAYISLDQLLNDWTKLENFKSLSYNLSPWLYSGTDLCLLKNNSRILLFLKLGHRSLQASKQQFCNSGFVLGFLCFVLFCFALFCFVFWTWHTCGKNNLTNSFQVLTLLSTSLFLGKTYLWKIHFSSEFIVALVTAPNTKLWAIILSKILFKLLPSLWLYAPVHLLIQSRYWDIEVLH